VFRHYLIASVTAGTGICEQMNDYIVMPLRNIHTEE
jgi:hypothetical protein